MIYLSVALFALAAIFGLAILVKWLTKKDVSRAVIYSHGLAAVIAFVALIAYAIQHPDNFPKMSVILFAIVAVAGLYMFIGDIRRKARPLQLAIIHALVAICAFVLLLFFVFA